MTELTERLARLEMIRLVDEVISESDPDLRDSLMIQLGTSGLLAERVEGQPKTMLVIDNPSSGPIEVKSLRQHAPLLTGPTRTTQHPLEGDLSLTVTVDAAEMAPMLNAELHAAIDNEISYGGEALTADVLMEQIRPVVHGYVPRMMAAELRRLADELDVVREEMREVDNRPIRSSGLGDGIRRLRARAAELDPSA